MAAGRHRKAESILRLSPVLARPIRLAKRARMVMSAAGLGLLTWTAPAVAAADPCKAIPDQGSMPTYLAPGKAFSGPVVYVGDGDSLCVGLGPQPDHWVEVRLADFYAPELSEPGGPKAKAVLERLAMGRRANCRAEHRSYDRVVARCAIAGRPLGELMREAGVVEGGNGR